MNKSSSDEELAKQEKECLEMLVELLSKHPRELILERRESFMVISILRILF